MAYVFNRVDPPLFAKGEHTGDPDSIPADTLEAIQGVHSWGKRINHPLSGLPFMPEFTLHKFTATRKLRWSWTLPIHYHIEDTNVTETEAHGYSRTEMKSVERMLGINIRYGKPTDAFAADAAANLKITEAVTQQWTSEKSVQIAVTYQAGYRYINWYLADEITVVNNFRKVRANVFGQPKQTTATVTNILLYRPEKFR